MANMDYMYSETYSLRVGIKMTVQQIEDLRGLAVKLLGDSDEAQAARPSGCCAAPMRGRAEV